VAFINCKGESSVPYLKLEQKSREMKEGGCTMEDLSRFCCQNSPCTDYGKRGIGNLTVCMHFGKEKRLRLLYCRTCQARFSERKGTPLFEARLPEATVYAVLDHIAEGCGIRKTGRLVGVSRGTVARYAVLAGTHAQRVQDELVAFSPADA
jgi:hypothetical protein